MAFIQGTIVKSRRTEKPALAVGPRIVSVPPPLKVNQFDLYICCSQRHLRRGGAIDLVLRKIQPGEIEATASAATIGQVFHPAILCFGAIILGSKHGQVATRTRGYILHGAALKGLNRALSEPNCYSSDDVLLAVSTLAILECLVPTGPRNYLKHMIGLERLLELRGPASCSSISFEIYKSVRHMILFASLRTGRPSILAREEWKRALRANCSSEEIPEQDLFDVLADCTVLVACRGSIVTDWELGSEKPQTQTRDEDLIRQSALGLLAQLRSWGQRWGTDAGNIPTENPRSFSRSPAEPNPEASSQPSPAIVMLDFQNVTAAVMWMFYHTTLIHVLRILNSLPPKPPSLEPCDNPIRTTSADFSLHYQCSTQASDEYSTAERLAAFEICRCMPYYSSHRPVDWHQSPIPHWAVTTARTTLCANETAEVRWILDLLQATSPDIVTTGVWIDRDG
ncbi:hypothetical protein Dda_9411 [Drechslerella dactyloides]|uniref:Uncharacterized protein n=1 Tax=Drechslerella dactyloides TaxID=74499 RepID=A0AAD6IPG5_DREDA|nr:hypothetical protein Dda_9411 [Drechslerella dactyloides]